MLHIRENQSVFFIRRLRYALYRFLAQQALAVKYNHRDSSSSWYNLLERSGLMVPFDQISLTDSQLALLQECVAGNRKDIPKSDDVCFLASVGLLIANECNTGYGVSLPTGQYRVSGRASAYLQYLECKAQQMSKERAENDAKERADRAYANEQNRKNRKHDLLVAGISVIGTLFFEHISEIIAFVAELIDKG